MNKKVMSEIKTKKKTLEVMWPSCDEYWTFKDLHQRNPQFVADITLRVRLTNAIEKEKSVAVIGDKMISIGRPQMVLAVRENGKVKQSVIDAAVASGIRLSDSLSSESISPVVVATATTTTENVKEPVESVSLHESVEKSMA